VGDETSWRPCLPPGEVGPQLSELELSESDSDSSVGSILGVCLDGFNGDAWMSDAEKVQDDIQVGEAAGVNDPGDLPLRTTAWSAGAEDVGSAKLATCAALAGKTVTFDLQGTALSDNDVDGERPGGGYNEGGKHVTGVNVPLTEAQKKEKRRLQQKRYRSPGHRGTTNTVGTSHHSRDRTTQQLAKLAKLSKL